MRMGPPHVAERLMPHSYNVLISHIVFATKARAARLDRPLEERLYPYIGGIARELGARLYTINGVEDHVHLLASLPATSSTASVIGKLKGCSSKWVNETFPRRRRFAWQRGYAAFSVSQSRIPHVARYIERQKEHHRKVSFEEEYVKLLESHGISPDPRFLWT
jgi:putative transposase